MSSLSDRGRYRGGRGRGRGSGVPVKVEVFKQVLCCSRLRYLATNDMSAADKAMVRVPNSIRWSKQSKMNPPFK
jgi:hypothetical protein